jgi:UDP-N-acetylglucosamine--N-acetylmuramyl-(pentapeptide) pyrophosphoryl-undecaprenol N-acetylglucosamine transferase
VRVVIAGGGTAGHVFPAVALARRLLSRGDHEVKVAGTERGPEARLVREAGLPFVPVEARALVRKFSPAALAAPVALLRSVGRCEPLVRGADVVVGMGGYVSGPVVMAAHRARRPVVLHEQNAVPGLANRLLSRRARSVALTFPEAARLFPRSVNRRITVTGNPVREEVLRVREERDALADEAWSSLDLDPGRRTVVVFGGSQGAVHIDQTAVEACRLLAGRDDLQVLILAGPVHHAEVERAIPRDSSLRVRTLPFLDRMELAYAVADLVVARAGATSIAEITACGLPSLLIPYPYATGRHQEHNARAVQRAGGAVVLTDDRLNAETLAERIESLIDHEERLQAMAQRAAAWGRPAAADALADLVEAAARPEPSGSGSAR